MSDGYETAEDATAFSAPTSTIVASPAATRTDKNWTAEYLARHDIQHLLEEFRERAASIAKVIIQEVSVPLAQKTYKPSIFLGGVAGGEKYLVDNILFKYANDHRGVYGGEDLAMKAAGAEHRSMVVIDKLLRTDLKSKFQNAIVLPLMCVIDYMGFRMIAQSQLPIRGAETLAYGSDNGGRTVYAGIDRRVDVLMEQLGAALNLRPHMAGISAAVAKRVCLPGDIEAHLVDGRVYLVDTARVFPPEAPLPTLCAVLVPADPRMALQEIELSPNFEIREREIEQILGCPWELLPVRDSSIGVFVPRMPAHDENSRASRLAGYPVRGDAIVFSRLKRPGLVRLLRPELVMAVAANGKGFRFPALSSDAFSNWDACDPEIETHERDIRAVTRRLREEILPQFAHALLHDVQMCPVNARHLAALAHQCGINSRFLGLLRGLLAFTPTAAPPRTSLQALAATPTQLRRLFPTVSAPVVSVESRRERISSLVLTEMVTRVAKLLLRLRLRQVRSGDTSEYKRVAAEFLNDILLPRHTTAHAHSSSPNPGNFWTSECKILLQLYYGAYCSSLDAEESVASFDLRTKVCLPVLVHSLQDKTGIRLRPEAAANIIAGNMTRPLSADDIARIEPRMKVSAFTERSADADVIELLKKANVEIGPADAAIESTNPTLAESAEVILAAARVQITSYTEVFAEWMVAVQFIAAKCAAKRGEFRLADAELSSAISVLEGLYGGAAGGHPLLVVLWNMLCDVRKAGNFCESVDEERERRALAQRLAEKFPPSATTEPIAFDWLVRWGCGVMVSPAGDDSAMHSAAKESSAINNNNNTFTVDELYVWGNADHGQLGLGDTQTQCSPVAVPALHGKPLDYVACGEDYVAVIAESGRELWTWGENKTGYLGHADPHDHLTPALVSMATKEPLARVICVSEAAGRAGTIVISQNGGGVVLGELEGDLYTAAALLAKVNGSPVVHVAPKGWVLTANGTVYHNGRPVQELINKKITQLRAVVYAIALEGDTGRVYTRTTAAAGFQLVAAFTHKLNERIVAIDVGMTQFLALSEAGRVYMWTAGGRTGEGTDSSPQLLPTLSISGSSGHSIGKIIKIACGYYHAAMLTECGRVWTFGDGGYGQLGRGDFNTDRTPRLVTALKGKFVRQIACGGYFTVALAGSRPIDSAIDKIAMVRPLIDSPTAGAECGRPALLSVTDPYAADDVAKPTLGGLFRRSKRLHMSPVAAAERAAQSKCCVMYWSRQDGPVFGFDLQRLVSDASVVSLSSGGLRGFAFANARSYAALTANGRLVTWGRGGHGELGHADSLSVDVDTGGRVVRALAARRLVGVDLGGEHLLAVDVDGVLWACGRNAHGQLGLGDYAGRAAPRSVSLVSPHRVVQVAAGSSHSLAVVELAYPVQTPDAGDIPAGAWRVFSWGNGQRGALGHGSVVSSPTPRLVRALADVDTVMVAAGAGHSAALDIAGHVWCWGAGSLMLGKGPKRDEWSPRLVVAGELMENAVVSKIACGHMHCVALVSPEEGIDRVYVWGELTHLPRKEEDIATQPREVHALESMMRARGETRISHIDAGFYTTAVLTTNHSLYTWRNQGEPALVDFGPNKKVVAAACGDAHVAAVVVDREC